MPEISRWWKDNVGSEDEQKYTKRIVERFDKDDDLKLLIVVDKLLTGFDEPKNTVLYIDKPLKEHNLIQAIARVNRLHPQKRFGLLIDYRGILSELDTTLQKYQDLATRTQGGYDIVDLAGLYRQMETEYKRLPQLYKSLWAIFSGVTNRNEPEQLRRVLSPNIQQVSGELVDVNEKRRGDFYDALTAFSSCLKVALQSATFYDDTSFTDEDHRLYKETVKQLSNLRRVVQQDAGERVDYDKYALDVKKLLDKHVVGVEIKDPTGFYDVGRMGESKPEEWDDAKTRNETDKIKTRITRTIEQQLQDDPYAQEAFSKLLRQAIEAAEQLFDHPLKQLMLFSEFEQQVNARRLDDIPDVFNGNHHAQAYFGVFKQVLPKVMSVADEQVQDKWVKFAFEIDEAVEKAVAENSINPQSIEASIRKALLPTMFRECKSAGYGMDQARDAVERVVQITRVGLAG